MDQSQMEMTMKTEVEEAGPSVAYVDIEIDVNHVKPEPGLVQLMKSEPALLVHDEILEKKRRGTGEQRGVPATSTRAIVSGTCVAADSIEQDQSLHVKDELEDTNLDIEPTVLQHMDSHYRTNQIDVNHVKPEPGLVQLMKSEPALLVHDEILEKKRRGTGEQRGVPATSTLAIVTGTCVAADSIKQDQSLHVKDELADTNLDIAPTVLQHMDSHYRTNQMSIKRNAWEPAPGDTIPGRLQGYVEDDTEEVLEEPKSELEDVDAEAVEDDKNWCVPSPPDDFGAPGTDVFYAGPDSEFIYIGLTDSMSPLPQSTAPPAPVSAATPDICHGRRFASITTSPFSPRPGTSRDLEHWAGLVDEDAFRSRSPLPGPSRESLPWETQEEGNEDVVYQERYLEEEEALMMQEEGGRSREVLAGMPVEMDVVDFTPCLSESVAPRRPIQRGLRSRGVSSRGATSHKGRHAATFPRSDESGWRLGDRLIEACVTDEDVPRRLRVVIDDVHERKVIIDWLARRRVFSEHDDDSDSGYDYESEQGIFGGDSTALNFDWSSMETYQSSAKEFVPETTGPVRDVSDPYDAFRVYWDDDILQHIVVETNRHAADISSRSPQFAREWIDTNVDEIMMLFAFWITLGIHKMPTISSCFSQHFVFKTDTFTGLITKQRYNILDRAVSFVDMSTRTPQSSRFFSLGPVIDHLKAAFMNAYTPGRDISIDELWKGNFVSTKTAKFAIRTFELCESATGYLWAFNVYTGKDSSGASSSTLPKSTKVVLDLVTPLLNKGHRLFMDNWFNSPILARYLKRNGTDCVGTLCKNRRNVPPLIQRVTLPRGHFVARHAGDVVVMAYQDTKTVHTISTCHGVDLVQFSARPGRPSHHKPAVIADYNKSMGRVDKKDQMLEPYLIERKRRSKWSCKLFRRLLNVSILNSRILLRQSSRDQCEHLVFQVDLVEGIVRRHSSQVPQPLRQQQQVSNNIPGLSDDRFLNLGQHFLVRARDGDEPLTGRNRSSKNRGLCLWCKVRDKRYSKTVYKCRRCDVYLCINECFENYHTLRE